MICMSTGYIRHVYYRVGNEADAEGLDSAGLPQGLGGNWQNIRKTASPFSCLADDHQPQPGGRFLPD